MISILINVFTVLLIVVALFLGLVVLAQRAKSDAGGMAAMGGGMVESAFGPDTSNVLTGLTIKATVTFFVLSFLIYLGYIYQRAHGAGHHGGALPNISAPATPPVTSTTAPATSPAAPSSAAPAVSVPTSPAPDAAKTTSQDAAPAKNP